MASINLQCGSTKKVGFGIRPNFQFSYCAINLKALVCGGGVLGNLLDAEDGLVLPQERHGVHLCAAAVWWQNGHVIAQDTAEVEAGVGGWEDGWMGGWVMKSRSLVSAARVSLFVLNAPFFPPFRFIPPLDTIPCQRTGQS